MAQIPEVILTRCWHSGAVDLSQQRHPVVAALPGAFAPVGPVKDKARMGLQRGRYGVDGGIDTSGPGLQAVARIDQLCPVRANILFQTGRR